MGFNLSRGKCAYPKHLRTRKAKIAYWILFQKYTFCVGKDKVGGWLLSMVQDVSMVVILLTVTFDFNVRNYPTGFIIFIICMLCGIWLLGKLYMSFELDRFENMVSEERSGLLKRIHDKMVNKEEVDK